MSQIRSAGPPTAGKGGQRVTAGPPANHDQETQTPMASTSIARAHEPDADHAPDDGGLTAVAEAMGVYGRHSREGCVAATTLLPRVPPPAPTPEPAAPQPAAPPVPAASSSTPPPRDPRRTSRVLLILAVLIGALLGAAAVAIASATPAASPSTGARTPVVVVPSTPPAPASLWRKAGPIPPAGPASLTAVPWSGQPVGTSR